MGRSLLFGSGIYLFCWLLAQRWSRFEPLILKFEIPVLMILFTAGETLRSAEVQQVYMYYPTMYKFKRREGCMECWPPWV